MKRRFAFTSVLVIAALLLAAVPAAANGEEPVFDYWGWDASCGYPFVGAGVYLAYEDGEPAVEIEVTFTMEGEDPVVTETDEWGGAWADFPFELGSDPVMIGIDAGEWGEVEVEVSGPDPETCEPVGSYSLTVACDGMSLAFDATGGAYGWDFVVQYADESDEYFDLGGLLESYTYEFDQPIIWAGAWVYNEFADDVFDYFDFIEATPGECPSPAPEAELTPQYYMWTLRTHDPNLPVGLMDTCYLVAPPGIQPSVERQNARCGDPAFPDYMWTADEVPFSGWVSLDVQGNAHYGWRAWRAEWYNPDFVELYPNLVQWNQEYLESVR